MSVLTAAPPEVELSPIPFLGRSLEAYLQSFALDPATLRGQAVLDVGAGPSSFVAEACRRGADAVAVDPLYGMGAHAVAEQARLAYAEAGRRSSIRERRSPSGGRRPGLAARWPRPRAASRRDAGTLPAGPDRHESDRSTAMQRFIADYEQHFAHGRYVAAALPQLPFLDRAFDLVLCGHLLFAYPDHFDFDWHVAALCELVRVSAGEVRLAPVCGPEGRRYAELDRLQQELSARGIRNAVVQVPAVLRKGAVPLLILNPAARN